MTKMFDKGDKPRLRGSFTVDSVATDPTAVALVVTLPDGSKESYLSATGFSDQGSWNASTNTPTLANGTGSAGDYYTVSVAGSVDFGNGSQAFAAGDLVAYDGDNWLLLPGPQVATLTKSSTGVYDYYYPVHQAGSMVYRFEGFGSVHAAGEGRIRVNNSAIR